MADAAALGITVCAACGDNGSGDAVDDGQPHVDFPASSPHALACGGTKLLADPATGVISSEVVWNETAANEGAGGGGVSDEFALPSWQADARLPRHHQREQRRLHGRPRLGRLLGPGQPRRHRAAEPPPGLARRRSGSRDWRAASGGPVGGRRGFEPDAGRGWGRWRGARRPGWRDGRRRSRSIPRPRREGADLGGLSGARSRSAGWLTGRRTAAECWCGLAAGMTSHRRNRSRPGDRARPCSWCASSHMDRADTPDPAAVEPPSGTRRTRAGVRPAGRARMPGCPWPGRV
jgi:hypothetical protein